MVGILIFVIATTTYFYYAGTGQDENATQINDMLSDIKLVSSSLISAGEPSTWNRTNVIRIGLTDGESRLMPSKLTEFSAMNYSYMKQKLGSTKQVYFYIEYLNGTRFNYVGHNSNSSDKLVQTTRMAIYNSTPVRMVVHIWQ
jgi:hypothetical protein